MSYPDMSLPEIAVPHFEGEKYEADVPETLDLVERAELGIRYISSM